MAEDRFWVGIHGLIEERGRILLLKRSPRLAYGPGCWDLPGGHLAIAESFEECLAREIREETSLTVTIERMLGLNKMPGSPYLQVLYLCRPSGSNREIRLQESEHVDARWVTANAIPAVGELIPYLVRMLQNGMLDALRGC